MKRTVTDAEHAARIIAGLADELGSGAVVVADAYAEAILSHAVRAAAGRPTPQAPMAAQTLRTQRSGAHGVAVTAAGGTREQLAVGWGSERGSSWFEQFASRRPGGYWLRPAADARSVLDAAADALDELVAAELGT